MFLSLENSGSFEDFLKNFKWRHLAIHRGFSFFRCKD
jgi:hypothetical protein